MARAKVSKHLVGGRPYDLKLACELALKGLVSKRADAPYTSYFGAHVRLD
jgi:ATP-dependent DNA ligase